MPDVRRGRCPTAAEQDLALAAHDDLVTATSVGHADRAVLVQQDAPYQCAGDDVQVLAIACRVQVSHRGGTPGPILLGDLVEAEAFLGPAVEVRVAAIAGLHAGLDEGGR